MFFGSSPNKLSKNKRALSKYSVGSQEPGLAFDFIDNVYQKDQNKTTNFSGAITHSRSGNAVMTDGYGPELVVNGGFDSDLSGWTLGNGGTGYGWIWQDGKAVIDNAGEYRNLEKSILEVGKSYVVTFEKTAGDVYIYYNSGLSSFQRANLVTNGRITFYLESVDAAAFVISSSSIRTTIDNVSVREMPVLKWAPHNLLSYSEDFSQSVWVGINGTLAADSFTASNDNNPHYFYQDMATISPTDHTASFEIKAYGDAQYFQIALGINDVSGNPFVNFDLLSGTITADASSVGTIVDVGDGWYRCEVSVVSAVSSNFAVVGVAIGSSSATRLQAVDASALNLNYGIRNAFAYRSDLGGMAGNPDQPPSRASYVPTTSSAVYLPRVGHHVFNGSAWVNEGLLAESEARTNLATYSDIGSWINRTGASLTSNDAIAPDGTETADKLVEDSATSFHFTDLGIVMGASAHTASVYLKAAERTTASIFLTQLGNHGAVFDLSSGTVDSVTGTGNTATIQDVGNGWYRCAVTNDGSADINDAVRIGIQNGALASYAGDGSSGIYVWGVQVEQGSTPSSLIPTSGSSVTRASESFTIPSANLPWPEPNYIGPELVTNGTFDTDTSGWTATDAALSVDSQRLKITSTVANTYADASQVLSVQAGKVYRASWDATNNTGSLYVLMSGSGVNTGFKNINTTTELYIVATSSGDCTIKFRLTESGTANPPIDVGDNAFVDNISVREIDPLSVSIAMDGRMTYADTNSYSEVVFNQWRKQSGDALFLKLSTAGTRTGEFVIEQAANNVYDYSLSSQTFYSPDVLVPYSIASRSGSTFVRGSTDGVLASDNTTPTALADLSATDLLLANGYMGTIGTFRVWDRDLGDDGIVEATNPSLEPSLSLDFLGTGTTSFTVSDWSE